MLTKASRLRRRIDFTATVRSGRRVSRGALVLHLVTEPGSDTTPRLAGTSVPRAGFVVSKAVGNAVMRNTVKRRLRHLVRDRLELLPDGAALVIRALPTSASRSYDQLGADLDAAIAAARAPRRPRPAP